MNASSPDLAACRTLDGFVPLLWDRARGRIYLRIRTPGAELLYLDRLSHGLGDYRLERGNLSRPQVVKDYLVGFSIDESRMEIVSMGEDQPQDPGHDEGAWARNRRAGFTITSGNTLTAPGQ